MKRCAADPLAKLYRLAERIAKLEARAPGSYFRFQDSGADKHKFEAFARNRAERFDEIVVGDWLHVEGLGGRSFYGSLGPLTLWWTVQRDGSVLFTHAEIRGPLNALPGAFRYILPELSNPERRRARRNITGRRK